MTKGMQAMFIKLYGVLLPLLNSYDERMAKLEEFDDVVGVDIPDWEAQLKEYFSDKPNSEEIVKVIDDFYNKYHVIDENGNKVFERTRMGSGLHQVVVTFDANAPKGQEFSIKEIPDIESMSLSDLKEYYEEVQSALDDAQDEEPEDSDSDEYSEWEDRVSDIEDLMQEIEDRIEELGGSV